MAKARACSSGNLLAAPDAGAIEEVRRHGSGHETVEEVGMAEAAGHHGRRSGRF